MADLNNIQGDIVVSLPKFNESFLFFEINKDQVPKFRVQLSHLIPLITTAAQGRASKQAVTNFKMQYPGTGSQYPGTGSQKPIGGGGGQRLMITGINIAFSQKGLLKLGISDDLGDQAFKDGMLKGAANLGDDINNWMLQFRNRSVDGVVLVNGDSATTVNNMLTIVRNIFSIDALQEIITINGSVRPDPHKGQEHFGFMDGISQPAIAGIDTNPHPGQETIPQGVILTLRDGDNGVVPAGSTTAQGVRRPVWCQDGSFLTFRKLQQRVPEFNGFMKARALTVPPGPGNPTGADFLAARLVGRWQSGAPLDLTPLRDNPSLGGNASLNDNFFFTMQNPDDQTSQERCPFAAHIRKSNPRGDLARFGGTTVHRIIRRGIQYGPELTDQEKLEGRTIEDRGLLFACYQSNIQNGFQFIQQSWVNEPRFPPKGNVIPGLDALIGGPSPLNQQATRQILGTNPANPNAPLPFFPWVFPQGGEYFFSPSISALKQVFARVS